MKTKHVYAAIAAVVAPLALTVTLSGMETAGSTREVLRNMPALPWPLEIPSAEAVEAPAKPKVARPVAPAAAPKSSAPVDASLAQCCAALHGKSATAREDARDAYAAAARVCDAVSASSAARDALAKVQTKMQGAELPLECR